jgi:hypothetical protein
MSDYEDIYGSTYLSADDVKKPFTTIIKDIDEGDFGSRKKKILVLKGVRKPVVLNKTNAGNLSEEYGKDFDWVGKPVLVKAERTQFQGKPVMGLRLYPAANEGLTQKLAKKDKPSSDVFDDALPDDL